MHILRYESSNLDRLTEIPHKKITIGMPSINFELSESASKALILRAGVSGEDYQVIIINDDIRKGYVWIINKLFRLTTGTYFVYVAEDCFPGRYWLKIALKTLSESQATLLPFNDGKWFGKLASFGMLKVDWGKVNYSGDLFYSGYKSHFCDKELTDIAISQNKLIYNPHAILIEVDSSKSGTWKSNPFDHKLYLDRK